MCLASMLNGWVSCFLTSCRTHTCHIIVLTNIIVKCATYVRNNTSPHTFPLTHATWSSPNPHHTHAIQLTVTANTSPSLKPCQMWFTSLPTGHAVPGPRRNVSKALEFLQRLLLTKIDTECKSYIQMRILIEYRMHMHMPAEHTQCNDKYTILSKQKASMFPRCTLTEWGQSANITDRIGPSCQRI